MSKPAPLQSADLDTLVRRVRENIYEAAIHAHREFQVTVPAVYGGAACCHLAHLIAETAGAATHVVCDVAREALRDPVRHGGFVLQWEPSFSGISVATLH